MWNKRGMRGGSKICATSGGEGGGGGGGEQMNGCGSLPSPMDNPPPFCCGTTVQQVDKGVFSPSFGHLDVYYI